MVGRPKVTHCKNGHERTPENLTSGRQCIICATARNLTRRIQLFPPAPKYCVNEKCGKMLEKKEGERSDNWKKRKTCDTHCAHIYATGRARQVKAEKKELPVIVPVKVRSEYMETMVRKRMLAGSCVSF